MSAIMKIYLRWGPDKGNPSKESETSEENAGFLVVRLFTFCKIAASAISGTMANPDVAQVSSLPLPPMQYISLYTDENVKLKRVPKPPPPIHDSYNMFGHTFNADDTIIRSLESQGIKRLYPQHFDRRKELRKLNHSLLVNFLDLLDTLVLCPDSPKRTEKVDDLSLLFFHIHHLLNEFRPHQARETLRVMMEMQKRQRNETAIRFQKHLDKVLEIINTALHNLPDYTDDKLSVLISAELIENMDTSSNDSKEKDIYTELDKQMCEIVDAL